MIKNEEQFDQAIPHVMPRATWDRMRAAPISAGEQGPRTNARSVDFYKLTQAIEDSRKTQQK